MEYFVAFLMKLAQWAAMAASAVSYIAGAGFLLFALYGLVTGNAVPPGVFMLVITGVVAGFVLDLIAGVFKSLSEGAAADYRARMESREYLDKH